MRKLYEVQYQSTVTREWRKSYNGFTGQNPFTSLIKAKAFAKEQHEYSINPKGLSPKGLTYRVVEVQPDPVLAVYGEAK